MHLSLHPAILPRNNNNDDANKSYTCFEAGINNLKSHIIQGFGDPISLQTNSFIDMSADGSLSIEPKEKPRVPATRTDEASRHLETSEKMFSVIRPFPNKPIRKGEANRLNAVGLEFGLVARSTTVRCMGISSDDSTAML